MQWFAWHSFKWTITFGVLEMKRMSNVMNIITEREWVSESESETMQNAMLGGKLKSINIVLQHIFFGMHGTHAHQRCMWMWMWMLSNLWRAMYFWGNLKSMHPSNVQHNLLNVMIQFYALATGRFFLLHTENLCACHATWHAIAVRARHRHWCPFCTFGMHRIRSR